MILQSEYDAIVREKRLKMFFIILVVLAVAMVLYFAIKVGKEKFMLSQPNDGEVSEMKSGPSAEKGAGQSPDASGDIPKQLTPEEVSAYESAAKQAESVQQQSSAGTLSAEEARDRLREIGKSIPVPPPPPTVKK